jgi:hypothetical protein
MGFQVLTAVVINVAISCDMAPYTLYFNRRFGGKYHLHLQARKLAKQKKNKHVADGFAPPKYRFTYGLRGPVSQKMAKLNCKSYQNHKNKKIICSYYW